MRKECVKGNYELEKVFKNTLGNETLVLVIRMGLGAKPLSFD